MSNMSYCRFHNTVGDFQDCMDALETIDEQGQGLAERAAIARIEIDELNKIDYSMLTDEQQHRYDHAEECLSELDNAKLSGDEKEKAYELIRMAKEMTDRFESLDLG